jgi:putative nucleotidyltransferase with HDIG domain
MHNMSTTTSWNDLVERARAAEHAGALDEALAAYEAAFQSLSPTDSPAQAAELMRCIGTVQRQRGELDLAHEACDASLAIADAAGLQPETAFALNGLAVIAQARGNADEAESFYAEAKYIAGEIGDERLAALIDQNLGSLANAQGDVEFAVLNYRSALGRLRRLGDTRSSSLALNQLGMAYVNLSEWENAESCYDEAFDLADNLRDTALLATVELNRAGLYLKRHEHVRARDCCDRAFEISRRLESSQFLCDAYRFYGVLYRDMQRPGLSDAHFQHALDMARSSSDLLREAETLSEWALLELEIGHNREALHKLNRAHALFEQVRAGGHAVESVRRLDVLEGTYLRVVQRWAESIESKDMYTAGHCTRLVGYASRLAEVAGFAGRELTWFRMGAFLHDVGKTAVPAEVLNKPGKLTPEEWDIMKRHTIAGDEIVADLSFPWDIRPIVRSHHERWDGTGYPDRLSGEQIPLTARIICVADVFDALTTARSYRPALSRQEALRIMERDAGKIFDPELFNTFKWIISSAVEAAA